MSRAWWAVAVVAGHPGVHRDLSGEQGLEGFGVVEEFAAKAAVEPFNLTGCRR
jgi:hypothetical protein